MSITANTHLAICIPAHNEAQNLLLLLPEIDHVVAGLGLRRVSVFVFDDGSRDGTVGLVGKLPMKNAEAIIIRSSVRVGKASGLKHCIDSALELEADALVMMDADGQDDPLYLADLLAELKSGADVVNGRRTNRAHGLGKRLSSRAFNGAVRLISGEKLWDINSGLKAFSRRGAQALTPYFYGELHRVILVVATWLGLQVAEVPVVNRPRVSGRTKYGPARGWRGLFDLVTIQFLRRYHSRPGHLFSGVGSSLLGVGIALALLGGLSAYQAGGYSVLLWAGVTTGGFGLMLISFGFISELMLFLSKNPVTSVVTTFSAGQGPTKVETAP
jgi:glycosyltransferase involved in cell wall biosynthesis